MDFPQAVASGFRRYFDFSTRSSRSEFWYWVLFTFVGSGVLQAVDVLLSVGEGLPLLSLVFVLAVFIPSIAVWVRRLHDIDRSGWWYLLWFVPIIGMIILIVWACKAGDAGDNRFGADPLAAPRFEPGPMPEPPTPAPAHDPDPAPQSDPEPEAPGEPRRD